MSRKLFLSLGALVVSVATTAALLAQASVTLHFRNGETLSATLVDLKAAGFEVTVRGADRMIAKDQIAWVDFGHAVQVRRADLAKVSPADHLVVFRNGDTLLAEWVDVGGTSPLVLRFNTSGGEREISSNEVARIYLARPAIDEDAAAGGGDDPARGGMQTDGAIAVMANRPWTDSSLQVRAGEFLRFEVSRAIRFGTREGDTATADGNAEARVRAVLRSVPVRAMPVGGLIGRVGNGQPFAIGSAPESIRMPANGRLWLGINDLSFDDNSGWFRVVVTRGR